MLDNAIVEGSTADVIRTLNQSDQPYEFSDDDGNVVGQVEGVWQALEERNAQPEGFDADRRGYHRHVFKTDPESDNQPEVGWIMTASRRQWRVAEEPTREGFFLVWPLYWLA